MSDNSKAVSLRHYFTPLEWLSYALIITAGIFLRWCELEARPYHHDESQHAMFGKYFFDWPELQFYKYDPMMHAPLLYNLLRVVYTALGHTLWSARVPIALLGTLFLFCPLLFRRYFSSTALLALTAALSLSANMVYWSRFLIHDYFVLAALLLTLYGAVQSSPSRRGLYVLLGIALQFCIKANVYVTLAMIGGYLFFEAFFRYFILERPERPFAQLGSFLGRYFLLFLGVFAILAIALDLSVVPLIENHDKWKALIGDVSKNLTVFIVTAFVVAVLAYVALFFILNARQSLLSRIWSNISQHKLQFVAAIVVSAAVYSYITTSGFRHMQGILDVIFRESIPYWWNQHKIERIQGPFLFHFYMFAWYELVFLVCFGIQLYLFYRHAPFWSKIAGLAMVAVAALFALITLGYIAPPIGSDHWLNVADVSKQAFEELGKKEVDLNRPEIGTYWSILFAVWGEFKLKDCLDVFGLFLLLIHPVIVTVTHLYRREFTLAFWGYCFTASFFSYSFVGEKVPWLCVYPLAAGFVYLTLYFDDWFRRHPLLEYREFPLTKIFKTAGMTCLVLGLIFILENMFSLSALFAGQLGKKMLEVLPDGSVLSIWRPIAKGVDSNDLLFILGFLFYGLHLVNRWTGMLATVNLKIFLFVTVGIYVLRASILTNFVYAGEANEYISQVHTTKEFHDAALKLRELSLVNLREEPFTIYGDGDPVWPLTWYMIGVNDFKYSATPEEKKNFDYILQTWKENSNDLPPGFEKRRINLRGWWVPDFNQMTLKKFLNYSLNHTPWSTTGFTYVWVLRNPNKR